MKTMNRHSHNKMQTNNNKRVYTVVERAHSEKSYLCGATKEAKCRRSCYTELRDREGHRYISSHGELSDICTAARDISDKAHCKENLLSKMSHL